MSNPTRVQPKDGIKEAAATPLAGSTYIWGVIVVGLALLAWKLVSVLDQGAPHWHWFTLLVVVASLAGVKLSFSRSQRNSVTVTVADCFILIAFLLNGAALAILLAAVEALVTCFRFRVKTVERYLFNMAQVPITVLAVTAFFSGVHGPFEPARDLLRPQFFLVVGLGTMLYFLINTSLIAVGMSLSSRTPLAVVGQRHFPWLSPSFFANAAAAIMLLLALSRGMANLEGIIWISLALTLLLVSRLATLRARRIYA